MNQLKKLKHIILSLSLKKKWAIGSASVIFLSFALMSTILFVALYGWLYQQEEQEVDRTMQDLTAFFESQGLSLTIQDIQSNKGLMNSIINKDQTVRLLNMDGIEIVQINNTSTFPTFNERDVPRAGYEINNDDSEYISATGHLQLGHFSGYVQLIHPLHAFKSTMSYILTAFVLFGLCALLLSAWIGYILASYLLKPLRELKETMGEVYQNGLDREVHISYKENDEVGELIAVYVSMMNKLKESFEQQQQFMADASHELRTPVQVVEGHLALLNRWGKTDPTILDESLQTALDEVKKMKILIDEMLELARGQQLKEYPPINIRKYTDEVINEMKQLYPNVRFFHSEFDKEHLFVRISSNAIQQIMRNILINAIRYSTEPANINIFYEKSSDEVIIHIKDEGMGIPPEQLTKIFNRFYRVESARTRHLGGSGLGLSIVKMLVENVDGRVQVNSVEGEGSTFSLIFPLSKT
jgi:two-component system sensor histidine kinase ArlS